MEMVHTASAIKIIQQMRVDMKHLRRLVLHIAVEISHESKDRRAYGVRNLNIIV